MFLFVTSKNTNSVGYDPANCKQEALCCFVVVCVVKWSCVKCFFIDSISLFFSMFEKLKCYISCILRLCFALSAVTHFLLNVFITCTDFPHSSVSEVGLQGYWKLCRYGNKIQRMTHSCRMKYLIKYMFFCSSIHFSTLRWRLMWFIFWFSWHDELKWI